MYLKIPPPIIGLADPDDLQFLGPPLNFEFNGFEMQTWTLKNWGIELCVPLNLYFSQFQFDIFIMFLFYPMLIKLWIMQNSIIVFRANFDLFIFLGGYNIPRICSFTWNQILICRSLRFKFSDNSWRIILVMYVVEV